MDVTCEGKEKTNPQFWPQQLHGKKAVLAEPHVPALRPPHPVLGRRRGSGASVLIRSFPWPPDRAIPLSP